MYSILASMKILTAQQIRETDAYTIEHEPIESIDLMERAAKICVDWITKHLDKTKPFRFFCGLGNNGGDGLAIARMLHEKDYKVHVYVVRHSQNCSEEFKVNEQRLIKININIVDLAEDFESKIDLESDDIIIDAIFGSGLNKPIEGWVGELVQLINRSTCEIISIDIPSCLFCEDNSKNDFKKIVKATNTLTFEVPKLAFLFPSTGECTGVFTILDIGLDKEFISGIKSPNNFLAKKDVLPLLKSRTKFSHKGTYGHALLVAGSYGKMGAAVLSSHACMKSGAGLLTTHVPKCAYEIMQTSIPEAMISVDSSEHFLSDNIHLDKYDAIGIGPGIGTEKQTQNILKLLIQNSSIPMVIDADAINIISENKTWIPFIPKNSILTPHPKEFERLVGKIADDYERYKTQKEFALNNGVYVILKGAHTSIACPDGEVYFNSTGNPGMAKGGSGDVLTGIITGLLAQGYTPKEACIVGVYMHGLAGDIAAEDFGQESMIASDIIKSLGEAFKFIRHQ